MQTVELSDMYIDTFDTKTGLVWPALMIYSEHEPKHDKESARKHCGRSFSILSLPCRSMFACQAVGRYCCHLPREPQHSDCRMAGTIEIISDRQRHQPASKSQYPQLVTSAHEMTYNDI